nr:hypothetical protein [uncultured Allomuricauda sp.]
MLNYDIPSPNDINNVADWAEFYIAYLEESLSKAALSSAIEQSRGIEPPEDFITSVWSELEERSSKYGSSCPFNIDSLVIEPSINWKLIPDYMLCLIFALEGNPNTDAVSSAASGKLFERVSQVAVKNYIQGDCIVYGHPHEQTVSSIANTLLKEKFNQLPPSYRKDRNLDLFAWKSFDDERAGQIIMLVQCAAGHNWKTKLTELSLRAWELYIHFAAAPIKGFTIPNIISNVEDLLEHSRDAGVLFDRTRLYKNICVTEREDDFITELNTWCDTRLLEILN